MEKEELRKNSLEIPGGPMIRIPCSLHRAWVQSLIKVLKCHKLPSTAKEGRKRETGAKQEE